MGNYAGDLTRFSRLIEVALEWTLVPESPDGQVHVQFRGLSKIDGALESFPYGLGTTRDAAAFDYLQKIAGQPCVVSRSGEHRRPIRIPAWADLVSEPTMTVHTGMINMKGPGVCEECNQNYPQVYTIAPSAQQTEIVLCEQHLVSLMTSGLRILGVRELRL